MAALCLCVSQHQAGSSQYMRVIDRQGADIFESQLLSSGGQISLPLQINL